MLILFEGVPGSGKTYDAVSKIIDNLKMKRVVYTNIDGLHDPRNREAIKNVADLSDSEIAHQLRFLNREDTLNFWEICEDKSLIVIDEAQLFFNAKDWGTQKNRTFADWASTHRHHGFDLVLITQRIERIDSAVRSLAEWTYRYRKVNFMGGSVKLKYIQYSYFNDDTSDPFGKKIKTYDKRIFACYNSYVASDIAEVGVMKHANILRHPVLLSIPVLVCLFIWTLSKSSLATGDPFGTNRISEQYKQAFRSEDVVVPDDGTEYFFKGKKNFPQSPARESVPPFGGRRTGWRGVNAPPADAGGATLNNAPGESPVDSTPEKILVGVVDGKKIYKYKNGAITHGKN